MGSFFRILGCRRWGIGGRLRLCQFPGMDPAVSHFDQKGSQRRPLPPVPTLDPERFTVGGWVRPPTRIVPQGRRAPELRQLVALPVQRPVFTTRLRLVRQIAAVSGSLAPINDRFSVFFRSEPKALHCAGQVLFADRPLTPGSAAIGSDEEEWVARQGIQGFARGPAGLRINKLELIERASPNAGCGLPPCRTGIV